MFDFRSTFGHVEDPTTDKNFSEINPSYVDKLKGNKKKLLKTSYSNIDFKTAHMSMEIMRKQNTGDIKIDCFGIDIKFDVPMELLLISHFEQIGKIIWRDKNKNKRRRLVQSLNGLYGELLIDASQAKGSGVEIITKQLLALEEYIAFKGEKTIRENPLNREYLPDEWTKVCDIFKLIKDSQDEINNTLNQDYGLLKVANVIFNCMIDIKQGNDHEAFMALKACFCISKVLSAPELLIPIFLLTNRFKEEDFPFINFQLIKSVIEKLDEIKQIKNQNLTLLDYLYYSALVIYMEKITESCEPNGQSDIRVTIAKAFNAIKISGIEQSEIKSEINRFNQNIKKLCDSFIKDTESKQVKVDDFINHDVEDIKKLNEHAEGVYSRIWRKFNSEVGYETVNGLKAKIEELENEKNKTEKQAQEVVKPLENIKELESLKEKCIVIEKQIKETKETIDLWAQKAREEQENLIKALK